MAEVAGWKQKKRDFIFRKLIFPVLFGILFILHLNALFLVKSLFVSRGVQTNFKTLLISISFKNLQFTKPRLPDHVITIIQKSTFPHKFVWLTRKVSLSEYWFTFSSITSFNQLNIKIWKKCLDESFYFHQPGIGVTLNVCYSDTTRVLLLRRELVNRNLNWNLNIKNIFLVLTLKFHFQY